MHALKERELSYLKNLKHQISDKPLEKKINLNICFAFIRMDKKYIHEKAFSLRYG